MLPSMCYFYLNVKALFSGNHPSLCADTFLLYCLLMLTINIQPRTYMIRLKKMYGGRFLLEGIAFIKVILANVFCIKT